jgi:hypothetical protein
MIDVRWVEQNMEIGNLSFLHLKILTYLLVFTPLQHKILSLEMKINFRYAIIEIIVAACKLKDPKLDSHYKNIYHVDWKVYWPS